MLLKKFKELFSKVSGDTDMLELVVTAIGIMVNYITTTAKARARLEAAKEITDRDIRREFAEETIRIAQGCDRYFDAAVSFCGIVNRQAVSVGLEPFCPTDTESVHDFCAEVVRVFGDKAMNADYVADMLSK